MSYDKVKTLLLEHETRLANKRPQNDNNIPPAAFIARKNTTQIRCYNCNQIGHKSPNCTKPRRGNRNNSHQENDKVAFLVEYNDNNPDKFVVDSGASDHLVMDEKNMKTVEALPSPIEIKIAKNDQTIQCHKRGTIELNSCVNGREILVTLRNVLIAPGLRHNLLSVQRIVAAGGEVVFRDKKVLIKQNGKLVLEGTKTGNLFFVAFNRLTHESNLAQQNEQNNLWHKRLGHLGINNMCKLRNGTWYKLYSN